MQLKMRLTHPGMADGAYVLKAKGCLAASFRWADINGALADWTPFAFIPVKANGSGIFKFIGERAIPPGATHVLVQGIGADFSRVQECLAEIPKNMIQHEDLSDTTHNKCHFFAMSDLHISAKTGRLEGILQQASKADFLLLPGDLVNDGKPEQFALLKECIEKNAPDLPVFTVSGNHDFPLGPIPQSDLGVCNYYAFQDWNRRRAEQKQIMWEQEVSGAYAVRMGDVDIIGLNAASHWRRFVFPRGKQLAWLKQHLEQSNAGWHVIMCHAPLLAHNPQRELGKGGAYLSRDIQLQEILDSHENIIFLSGHTHVSPNILDGCVESDKSHHNFYINDGSICPTELKEKEVLNPAEWADGNITEINLAENELEITMKLIRSGQRISRGYYRFCKIAAPYTEAN